MSTTTTDEGIEPLLRALDAIRGSDAMFYPQQAVAPPPEGAVDYDVPVGDGVTLGARWHVADPRFPTVLAFHGNGETVSDYDDIAGEWRQLGLNFFMVDYRGYGWSRGRPTLRSLAEDPAKIADFFFGALADASRAAGLDRAPTPLLFGRSLGSSPASRLARDRGGAFQAVILESGFGDFRALLDLFQIDLGDLRAEATRHFSNAELLKDVHIPVLILHGAKDRLLSPEHARANYGAVAHEDKQLAVIDGAGHNDILMFSVAYFGAIQAFLQKHGALAAGSAGG